MNPLRWWHSCLAVLLATSATAVFAQTASSSFEERLSRVERLVDTNALIELVDRVTRLQREIQDLRGELEVQNFALTQLKQQQRELYLDLDRRLTKASPSDANQAASESPATPPAPDASAIDPLAEEAAYQQAFNLLRAKRYDQAQVAFQDFLRKYQGGSFADNAQYWLGEAYYVTGQFDPALDEFQALVQRYPDSQKLTHAMLKIGYIYDELGKTAEAQATLQDLAERYPNTTAARLARERLQKLKAANS